MKFVTLNALMIPVLLTLALGCTPKATAIHQSPAVAKSTPVTPARLPIDKAVYYVFENGAFVQSKLDTLQEVKSNFRDCPINYPASAKESSIQGTVWVTLIVNEAGQVENATVSQGIGGGCDQEALIAVKCMYQSRSKPFLKNGKPVRVKIDHPTRFRLN